MGKCSKQACDLKLMTPFAHYPLYFTPTHPAGSRQHLSCYEYQQGLAHDILVGIMCDEGFKSWEVERHMVGIKGLDCKWQRDGN